MNKNRKGFTVKELLIVLGIVAALAIIGIVAYNAFRNKEDNPPVDNSMVGQLNTYSKTYVQSDSVYCVSDLTESLKSNGVDLSTLTNDVEGEIFAFDIEAKKFFAIKLETGEPVNYFITNRVNAYAFAKSNADITALEGFGYSIYCQAGNYASTITISKGLDVGVNDEFITINYTNTSSAQNVIIRTNNVATTLNINGYENNEEGAAYKCDTIKHFNKCGIVNISCCGTASYHEYGEVGFTDIAKGSLVLEKPAKVKVINISKKDDLSYDLVSINDKGVTKLPEIISREQVTVTDVNGIRVCEVITSAGTELVKAYPEVGVSNSTEKINSHNEAVTSTLGMLVIDSGSKAGEKAYDQNKIDIKLDEVAFDATSAAYKAEATTDYVARIGKTGYMSLASAIEAAIDNAIVVLLKDTTMEVITLDKPITLEGGNFTITGTGNENGAEAFNKSGFIIDLGNDDVVKNVNLRNFTLTEIGNKTSIYAKPTNSNKVYVNLTNVKVENFYRHGITFEGGTFSLDGCTLDATNTILSTFNSITVDGEAYGYTPLTYVLTGTVKNTKFVNSDKSTEYWTSSGIGCFSNVNITVDNCEFENCRNAIATAGYNVGPIDLNVTNTKITNAKNGINLYDSFSAQTGDNRIKAVLGEGNNFECDLPIYCAKAKKGTKIEVVITGGKYASVEYLYTFADGITPIYLYDSTSDPKTSAYFNFTISGGQFILDEQDVTEEFKNKEISDYFANYVWYSNGNWNNGEGVSAAGYYSIYTIIEENWLASGEGIKLTKDIELTKNLTCLMNSGTFYLYFQGHELTGGTIVLANGVSVVSDTCDLESVFSGGTITCVNSGNNTYTYTCSAD